jgi:hypothetical protein
MKMVFASFVILFSTMSAQAVQTGLEGVNGELAASIDSFCKDNKVIAIIGGRLLEQEDCNEKNLTCTAVVAQLSKDNRPHVRVECQGSK